MYKLSKLIRRLFRGKARYKVTDFIIELNLGKEKVILYNFSL
jgi:hypothetical protein